MKPRAPDLTCPSAPCAPGATLVGVMGESGKLDYLRTPMKVDAGFVRTVKAQTPSPETRMRFAAPCQTTGCAQWSNGGCGVVRRVLDAVNDQGGIPSERLQPCVIRGACRWYAERGAQACGACKYVVTDQESLVAAE